MKKSVKVGAYANSVHYDLNSLKVPGSTRVGGQRARTRVRGRLSEMQSDRTLLNSHRGSLPSPGRSTANKFQQN